MALLPKIVQSEWYNSVFDPKTGFFCRWGRDRDDDPSHCPLGPEIADIEISTACTRGCSFCYKDNSGEGLNMRLSEFQDIFRKLPKVLGQVALGIGDINRNPDLFSIMEFCRENDYNPVVPNLTISGEHLDDYYVDQLVHLAGCVCVSRYHPSNTCYSAVKRLDDARRSSTTATLQQINIHQILSEETLDACFQLIRDADEDKRLEGLNAIVFLMAKPKGRSTLLPIVNERRLFQLLERAQGKKLNIGFDSCSAPLALRYLNMTRQADRMQLVEPCESSLFSIYINVEGNVYPCSFTEPEGCITNMENVQDFLPDVWRHPDMVSFRRYLLESSSSCDCPLKSDCRSCPVFDITVCRENPRLEEPG